MPLAEDSITLRDALKDNLELEGLVCHPRVGIPLHLTNWRRRIFDPAAARVGREWATPYTGRRTYVSLMIHAGVSPVMVAAAIGHTSGETIWKHCALYVRRGPRDGIGAHRCRHPDRPGEDRRIWWPNDGHMG